MSTRPNLRILYEDVGITKLDLFPIGPEPFNWNAYREVVKRINFRHNGGMGGPLDTVVSSAGAIPVTARGIDIEVEYMGGEKVALHAVGIRDSITNILMAPLSVSGDYYDSLTAEIQDISRADSNHVVHPAFLSIDL